MRSAAPDTDPTPLYLVHEAFVAAWRKGELRIHIDPTAASSLVSARLLLPFMAVATIGLGIGLVLWGWLWTGIAVGVFGILVPRLIKRSAAGFLLERIAEDPVLYQAAIDCKALSYVRMPPAS